MAFPVMEPRGDWPWAILRIDIPTVQAYQKFISELEMHGNKQIRQE